jgi:hypothetical protein
MNRFKKSQLLKFRNARYNLSEIEVKTLDASEAAELEFQACVRKFHLEIFPEEYDFMMNSNVDIRDRNRGSNPMSVDYEKRVNIRRAALGVRKFSVTCRQSFDNSWIYARNLARLTHPTFSGDGTTQS